MATSIILLFGYTEQKLFINALCNRSKKQNLPLMTSSIESVNRQEKFVFRFRSSKCTICMSFHLFKRFLDEKMTQTCIECFPRLFSNLNLVFSGKFQVF